MTSWPLPLENPRAIDTLSAVAEFTGRGPSQGLSSDFIVTGGPLPSDARKILTNQGQTVLQFMVGFRTVGVFANFPGLVSTGSAMNMTACDLAKILLGQVGSWNSSELDSIQGVALQYPSIFSEVR